MGETETELKFRIDDPDEVRVKLIEQGFASHGRQHEYNIVFDTPDGMLKNSGRLLRLRRDSRLRLTFKEPLPDSSPGNRYKVRIEKELEVSDFDTMHSIINSLGFTSERIYEKLREHLTREEDVSAELDQLPHMGHFLEFEAPADKIEELAIALGFDIENGRCENYFQLFGEYCSSEGLDYTDLLFEDERKT